MDAIKFLETYILCEVLKGNKKYLPYLNGNFAVNDLILAEFYWTILREFNEATANYWFAKLKNYSLPCSVDLMLEATRFRFKHKHKNLSFFDAAGYIFAQQNNMVFVTGDKAFKDINKVEFVPVH